MLAAHPEPERTGAGKHEGPLVSLAQKGRGVKEKEGVKGLWGVA